MIVIVAVDDGGGMQFNHRRQSQDALLRQRILELARGKKLWMNSYSAAQFEDEYRHLLHVDEQFMELAGADDYCLVETCSLLAYSERISGLVIFRWNRTYPGDLFFDLSLSCLRLVSCREFAGSSHEKISEEVYSL